MPYCARCKADRAPGATRCTVCGASLVEVDGGEDADAPVVILEAQSASEAQIVAATLQAEGIPAYTQPTTVVLPQPGTTVTGDAPELDVLVPPHLAERAAQIVNAPPPSDEEFRAAEGHEREEP